MVSIFCHEALGSSCVCTWFLLVSLAGMANARLTPFEIGQIKAHVYHGLSGAAISRVLKKPDGKSFWSETAIQDAINKLEDQPRWRGEREVGSQGVRKTTKKQDAQLYKCVMRSRGKRKVTVNYLRRVFSWTKNVGNTLLEERLHEAGLKYLRRRRKSIVTKKYIPERLEYCNKVVHMHQATLDTWGYTDGTVFYLDRTEDENEHTQRAAMGGWVWRHTDGRDAMFKECLGPSSYKKGQGIPVRVWGVFAGGTLYIHVLEEGEAMHEDLYVELIEDKFESWLGNCNYLVQDFERCLRCEGSLAALKDIGIELVQGYPRVSQDFNAIENCWKLLRDRLSETLPRGLESRKAFINRLHQAVSWVNRTQKDQLWYLARNQKERCRDCLLLKGGRTKW